MSRFVTNSEGAVIALAAAVTPAFVDGEGSVEVWVLRLVLAVLLAVTAFLLRDAWEQMRQMRRELAHFQLETEGRLVALETRAGIVPHRRAGDRWSESEG